jgi:hypothetical protein
LSNFILVIFPRTINIYKNRNTNFLYCVILGERIAKHPSSVHFYVVTQPRNSSSGPVADVGSDIETILGLYEAQNPEQKRYLAAIQNMFYRFVWHGALPTSPSGSERSTALPQSVLVVGQDVAVQPTYQNCDFWIQRQLAEQYGRID